MLSQLHELLIFLTAALLAVPLAKRFGLNSVLGYLIAGLVIGPSALGLIADVESILHFSEFGVVLLLFIIGLELEPRRLWRMRNTVFGPGSLQVGLTTLVFALIAYALALPVGPSIVVALGLALSSTAFVMSMLTEKKQLATKQGTVTFGILLFQDLAVIPVLALLPLLAGDMSALTHTTMAMSAAKAFAVFGFLVLAGRYAIRPFFRTIAATKSQELFIAASFFVVVGTSVLMEEIGLSMSLGAFVAGVLLANSEYRHELEANIEPFRGLLMGLFFMAVGMATNIHILLHNPLVVAGILVGFIVIKFCILYIIGRFALCDQVDSVGIGMTLAVGGEFAFVLYGMAAQYNIISKEMQETLILVVTLSMIASPILMLIKDHLANRNPATNLRPFDQVDEQDNQVIIAGFGRFGQVVGRLLRSQRINYTALEANADHVDFVRKFGTKLYYGDASNVELLRAAKADRAKVMVVAIDDVASSLKTIRAVKKHFPHLVVFARARNRQHAFALLDEGITNIYRETFLSSLEAAGQVLMEMGLQQERVKSISETFRKYDEETILRQHASHIHQDEKKLMEDAKSYAHVLQDLMELDETVVGRS